MSRKGLPYSPEEAQYVDDHFLTSSIREIAAHLGRSEDSINTFAKRRGLSKGGRRINPPGARPANYKPIGSTMAGNRGQTYVKVREGGWPDAWELLHRLNWEAVNGPVPEGHVLTFRDGDHTNAAVENLELVASKDWIKRYIPEHTLPPELAQLIRLKAVLVRQINQQTSTTGEQQDEQ